MGLPATNLAPAEVALLRDDSGLQGGTVAGSGGVWEGLVLPALSAYTAIYFAILLLPRGLVIATDSAFYDYAVLPVAVVAMFGSWRAARLRPAGSPARRAWYVFTAALVSWLLGSALWAYVGFAEVSIADVGFLAYYPLALLALLLFPVQGTPTSRRPEFWLDGLMVGIGGFMFVWHASLHPLLLSEQADLLNAAINWSYPILSLMLFLGAVTVWLRNPAAEERSAILILALGVLAFFGADIVYANQSLSDTYVPGGIADAGWFLATLAFVRSSATRPGGTFSRWLNSPYRMITPGLRYVPYAASAGGFIVLLYATAADTPHGITVFIAAGLLLTVLVLVRQIRSVREIANLQAENAAHRVRAETENRLRSLIQNSSDVILVVNGDGLIQFASPPIERDFHYLPEQVIGGRLLDLVHEEDHAIVGHELQLATSKPTSVVPQRFRMRRPSGEWRLVESVAIDLTSEEAIGGVVLNMRDVTDREAFEARLTHQAFHDSLTGLPNRPLFLDRLEHALDRSSRDGSGLTVLYLDLDNFKAVNDTFGHAAGDFVLQESGRRMLSATRGCDTVSRFGGDEYAILLEGAGDEKGAIIVARRLVESLQRPIRLQSGSVSVGASIGIAIVRAGESAEEIMRNADFAMYDVKHGESRPLGYSTRRYRAEAAVCG